MKMQHVWQELRDSVRSLWKARKSNAIVLCVLAFGIGLNTAMFAVLHSAVLHPLTYRHSDRLVFITDKGPLGAGDSVPNFVDWTDQNNVFESMGLWKVQRGAVAGPSTSGAVTFGQATPSLFSVLEVFPSLGRTFLTVDGQLSSPQVAVLSEGYWKCQYGADPNIIGKQLRLDGLDLTVIGVVDPGRVFSDVDLWEPLSVANPNWRRNDHTANVIARLKAGETLEQARANMVIVAKHLEREHAEANAGWQISLEMAEDAVVRDAKPTTYLLFLASVLVLLIACANISSLLLVKAVGRSREFAIRMALGSSRARTFRQLIFENLFLCSFGGVLGLCFFCWAWKAVLTALPATIPRPGAHPWDVAVMAFATATVICATLLIAVASAWRICTEDLAPLLHEGASPFLRLSQPRFRLLVLIGQVAIAVTLSVCALLAVRSFINIRAVNLGFDPNNLLVVTPEPPEQENNVATGRNAAFFGNLLDELDGTEQFQAVGAASAFPLSGTTIHNLAFVPGDRYKSRDTNYSTVSPEYFSAMGIPLVKGRVFTREDHEGASPVVVLSEAAAQQFWPQQDPLGKTLKLNQRMTTVVGIVANVRWLAGTVGYQDLGPELYVPASQDPAFPLTALVIRTRGNPRQALAFLRGRSFGTSGGVVLTNVQLGDGILSAVGGPEEQFSFLLGAFAALALGLAVVGIYGLVSHLVTERTPEIAIRMVLGAEPSTIFTMIMKQGMYVVLTGIAAGVLGALTLAKFLRGIVYGIEVTDFATYSVAALSFVLISLLTLFALGKRASLINPGETLKL